MNPDTQGDAVICRSAVNPSVSQFVKKLQLPNPTEAPVVASRHIAQIRRRDTPPAQHAPLFRDVTGMLNPKHPSAPPCPVPPLQRQPRHHRLPSAAPALPRGTRPCMPRA